jgi:hypothetical protein
MMPGFSGAYGHIRPGEASLPSTSVVSSSYSGYTGGRTPYGAALPTPPSQQREISLAVVIVAFSGVLALVGALLGGYSLYARKPPVRETPRNVLPNNSTSTASALPGPSAPSIATESPSSHAVSDEPLPVRAASDAGASPAASVRGAAPQLRPTANTAPAATAPKPCDPPYVVDETGRRKYKRECMATD